MTATLITGIEYTVGSGTYQDLSSSSDIQAALGLNADRGVSAAPQLTAVSNSYPLLQSVAFNGRRFLITVWRDAGGSTTVDQFKDTVGKWFNPALGRSGTRFLRALHRDSSTLLRIPIVVHRLDPHPEFIEAFLVEAEATVNYFEKITQTSTTTISGSASITNNGNTRAPVQLEISSSVTYSGRRATITDRTGRGVYEYPIVLYSGITSFQRDESYVIVNGESVPFLSNGTQGNDYIWLYVTVPANGTLVVDIIRNTGLTNARADTLDMGNILLSNTSNSTLKWNIQSMADIVDAPPGKSAMWYPWRAQMTAGGPSDLGFEIGEGTSAARLTQNAPASGQKQNANSMICTLGIEAGSSNALTNLSRVTANHTSQVRSFCRFRKPGRRTWNDGWTQTGNGTVTSAIDVDEAHMLIVGIEPTGSSPTDGATLDFSGNDISLALDSTKTLTISYEDTTWMYINGAVTNVSTGQVITFDDVFCIDGTLTIDTNYRHLEKAITTPDDVPYLGDITETDGVDLFSLDEGSNSITETVSGDVTVKHRDAWVAVG